MVVGFRFSGFHPSGGRSWLWPDDSAASHPGMRIVRACGHGIGWPYLLSASGGCAGFVSWLVLWHCFVNCLFVFFWFRLFFPLHVFHCFSHLPSGLKWLQRPEAQCYGGRTRFSSVACGQPMQRAFSFPTSWKRARCWRRLKRFFLRYTHIFMYIIKDVQDRQIEK